MGEIEARKTSWMPEVYQGATAVATGAAVGFGVSQLSEKEGEEKPVIDNDDQDGQTTTPSTEKPNTQVNKTEDGGLPGWAWALIILAAVAAIGTAVYFCFFTGESEEDLEAGL